jgi:hypothetical protein
LGPPGGPQNGRKGVVTYGCALACFGLLQLPRASGAYRVPALRAGGGEATRANAQETEGALARSQPLQNNWAAIGAQTAPAMWDSQQKALAIKGLRAECAVARNVVLTIGASGPSGLIGSKKRTTWHLLSCGACRASSKGGVCARGRETSARIRACAQRWSSAQRLEEKSGVACQRRPDRFLKEPVQTLGRRCGRQGGGSGGRAAWQGFIARPFARFALQGSHAPLTSFGCVCALGVRVSAAWDCIGRVVMAAVGVNLGAVQWGAVAPEAAPICRWVGDGKLHGGSENCYATGQKNGTVFGARKRHRFWGQKTAPFWGPP